MKYNKSLKLKRKKIYLAASVGILLLFLFILLIRSSNSPIVATVNNEPINIRLFERQISQNRAIIINYFNTKYGAEFGKNFWTSLYNDERPEDVLKKRSLDDCIKFKIEDILARKYGILDKIDYDSFLESLKEENRRRDIAIKNNEVIYGPEQYTEVDYYSYRRSIIEIDLKEELKKNVFDISEKDLKDYYEKNKEQEYKRYPYIKVIKFVVPFEIKSKDPQLNNLSSRELVEYMYKRLTSGETFEELAADMANDLDKEIKIEEKEFDPENIKDDFRSFPRLRDAANYLAIGELSDIIEENRMYTIMKCTNKDDIEHFDYDTVKLSIENAIVDNLYNDLIQNEIKKANVVINEKAYNKKIKQ